MKLDVLALEVGSQKPLARAAEFKVQLDRARGIASGKVVPHDSVIEDAAHAAGMAFRRELPERHMRELAATHVGTARCPKWGERCPVDGGETDGHFGGWAGAVDRTEGVLCRLSLCLS